MQSGNSYIYFSIKTETMYDEAKLHVIRKILLIGLQYL